MHHFVAEMCTHMYTSVEQWCNVGFVQPTALLVEIMARQWNGDDPFRKSIMTNITGNPLHIRALAHSRAPLFTQPCPHCSHSRAPWEQWARLCVFTLQGCVQAARLCRGSPVNISKSRNISWDFACHFQWRHPARNGGRRSLVIYDTRNKI